MRLFIAINFSDDVKNAIYTLSQELKSQSQGGRFCRRENLHLTLAFLGEVEPQRVSKVEKALASLTIREFNLTFDHLGRFKGRGGDIRWLGIKPCPELLDLHQALCQALKKEGFALEERPFTPHLTLGRQVTAAPLPPQGKKLAQPIGFEVRRISLMLSQRCNNGVNYSELYCVGPGACER